MLVIADGLSALAVERHARAAPARRSARGSPMPAGGSRRSASCGQGRVAIGDEIGALLAARLAVMLIGERPGLSVARQPRRLPHLGPDARPHATPSANCISNIRPEGLGYAPAAHKLFHLMTAARLRLLTGIDLKEDAPALSGPQP